MPQYLSILLALFFSAISLRADLILEQQSSDTNRTRVTILKLHGDKLRMDQPEDNFSVIIDLSTRDSYTLLTTNKTYLKRLGSQVRRMMQEERTATGGTNEVDARPALAVDTGRAETVNGSNTEIYTWSGAHGLTETLWVAREFPNYDAIRPELLKLDQFNESGPHRNAQPALSLLPGMVIKSESAIKGHKTTTTLVSVKVEPVDPSLFDLPADYKPYKPPEKKAP
jgi:hypothetical protein